jgi:hypothetical protein
MTLYQGNQKNWQITVTIWAPMQKTISAVKIRDPDPVFIQAGVASSGRVDKVLESLLRQFQLILKASKIRKNFQFHTAGKGVQESEADSLLAWISGFRSRIGEIGREARGIRKSILQLLNSRNS